MQCSAVQAVAAGAGAVAGREVQVDLGRGAGAKGVGNPGQWDGNGRWVSAGHAMRGRQCYMPSMCVRVMCACAYVPNAERCYAMLRACSILSCSSVGKGSDTMQCRCSR